ncbi:alpha/beta fold hydrolase [Gordonia sputi]
MQAGLSTVYNCVAQFSETDFTEDLRNLQVPILIAHGDDDQIVTIHDSAAKAIDLVKHGTLRIYPGASRGIHGAYQAALGRDIVEFLGE